MGASDRSTATEAGQAAPEWIGLVLLLVLLLVGAVSGLATPPFGVSLARTIGAKLVCAIQLSDSCERDPELVAAYGSELARAIREQAPLIAYETGMRALPVDYRSCRSPSCADGRAQGSVWRSRRGEPATAFVHAIDCRDGAEARFAADAADCSGPRAGNLYLQYWFYYSDSATLRGLPVAGEKGYHADDWEGYEVRIDPGGQVFARASSHHGFNYQQGSGNWGSDAGIAPLTAATEALGVRNRNGWGPATGWLFVSGGSHAGNVQAFPADYRRQTLPARLKLVPLEPAAAGEEHPPSFAISPPWLKGAWTDPEAEATS